MTRYSTLTKACAVLTLVLAGCFSSGSKSKKDVKDSGWVAPSPILAQQIQDEAKRLPWTHGFERYEQVRWFASVGEPAYPTLLELAVDPRDDVAAAALAALGATMDRRLVTSIHDLKWDESRNRGDLALERARTLMRLGDWSGIPTLIDALRDERVFTRTLAIESLKEVTRQDLGFDPKAEPEKREEGVKLWEAWWQERGSDGVAGR